MKQFTSTVFNIRDIRRDGYGVSSGRFSTLSGAKSGLRALKRAILKPKKYSSWTHLSVKERHKCVQHLGITKTITTTVKVD